MKGHFAIAMVLLAAVLGCSKETEKTAEKMSPTEKPSKVEQDTVLLAERQANAPEGMIWIPGGTFMMGSKDGDDDEKPVHEVTVDGFYMDQYEVTVGQFKVFCKATDREMPGQPEWNKDNHPAVNVSWNDAAAYAQWADKHLPTEAEWEYAARGGLEGKSYPCGDFISHDDANYYGTGGKDRWSGTSPVGSFSANPYGLYDMAGNVWEWCSDWYDSDYYKHTPGLNPRGPESGSKHVLRGGSWGGYAFNISVAIRNYYGIDDSDDYVGFRCVRSQ